MGHIKDIANQSKMQTFPSSTFEIEGTVPESQCSEARIESDTGQTFSIINQLTDPLKFVGFDLTGKVLHITASVGGNTGDFGITGNTDNTLNLDADPGDGNPVTYFVTNGGSLILDRDIASFAAFIHAAGYAYTIKGGKLYTNIPSLQLQPACTIVFDPLT